MVPIKIQLSSIFSFVFSYLVKISGDNDSVFRGVANKAMTFQLFVAAMRALPPHYTGKHRGMRSIGGQFHLRLSF